MNVARGKKGVDAMARSDLDSVVSSLNVILMRPRKTGFEAVDTLMEGELEKVHGFPFKSVTTTRTQGSKKKGRTVETISTAEVIEFQALNVADSTFALSSDSREISLLGLGSMEGQDADRPEDEEKGGLMKRFKRIRRGDG